MAPGNIAISVRVAAMLCANRKTSFRAKFAAASLGPEFPCESFISNRRNRTRSSKSNTSFRRIFLTESKNSWALKLSRVTAFARSVGAPRDVGDGRLTPKLRRNPAFSDMTTSCEPDFPSASTCPLSGFHLHAIMVAVARRFDGD